MHPLRIAFSDFIFGRNDRDRMASFTAQDNVFTRLLAQHWDVRVVPMAEAEVLVFSTFGEAHRAFRGRKVFYTSENVLPDFDACDHAITFCHLPDDPRHFRLPQYVFYVDDVQRPVWQRARSRSPDQHPSRSRRSLATTTRWPARWAVAAAGVAG
mgnify:CR=1 FL=1